MCNCNQNTNPCTNTAPCGSCLAKQGSSCTHYDGEDISCLNVTQGENLNVVLQALADKACNNQTSANVSVTNVGTGQGIYAGNDNNGAKKLKSIKTTPSITISATDTEISAQVNPTWLSGIGIDSAFPPNIISFSTANPNNSGTTFTPTDPANADAVYWSEVDNSVWKYNSGSSQYTVATLPSATPFYYAGTTNDAGGNKLAGIRRDGAIGIGVDPKYPLDVDGAIAQRFVTNSIVKAANDGKLIPAVAGTDYLTPTGSAAQLTNFPILNQNTTGNAATVTTIPNLTGDVTSLGNVTTLGNTAVTAGTYSNPTVTINSQGRITAATNGTVVRSIYDNFTQSQNGDSTLTILNLYAIQPAIMINNGDNLMLKYSGSLFTTSAKKLGVLIGSNQITLNIPSIAGDFTLNAHIIRSSASVGIISIQITLNGTAPLVLVQSFSLSSGWQASLLGLLVQAPNAGEAVSKLANITYVPKA